MHATMKRTNPHSYTGTTVYSGELFPCVNSPYPCLELPLTSTIDGCRLEKVSSLKAEYDLLDACLTYAS